MRTVSKPVPKGCSVKVNGTDAEVVTNDMRVLHVVGSTRVDHGGTSRSVPAICEALATNSVDVHLITGQTAGVESNVPGPPVSTQFVKDSLFFGRLFSGNGFSKKMSSVCNGTSHQFLVHDHGIWLPSNKASARTSRRRRCPRVVSPRGMLSDWAMSHGSRGKKIAWQLYQQHDLRTATAFHATSELEANELRNLGFAQPIAIIPNGVDLPDEMPIRQRHAGRKRMIFLSRIHPKKGLLNLVNAWKNADVCKDWELILVGPDEDGHRSEVQRAIDQSGLTSDIQIHGAVGDVEKWQFFVDSDMFVLPSFSENFGIVVVEALAAGLPVIATTGTPWESLPKLGMGWWVEPTIEELTRTLQLACNTSTEQLSLMSEKGARWAQQRFSWQAIGIQMVQFYNWLLSGGQPPDCMYDNLQAA